MTPVGASSTFQVTAVEAVDRLSKMLLDAYVETDEEVGPRVAQFEEAEGQLRLIGEQVTSMRDAISAKHEAHMAMIALSAPITASPAIPSVLAFGERQEPLARLSQSLAAQYDRFVNLSVNQLEGLALVVSNKYKAYTNKAVEMRRRKAQLQLLIRQKERSDLRSIERSLIPVGAGGFQADLEGTLMKQSTMTPFWWSCYARLDRSRRVLLFNSRAGEPPSAATKAVALSKYMLCHEVPEHYARRAAAFELVPLHPDLPIISLAGNGSLETRKWVCALQEAIDTPADDEAPSPAPAAVEAAVEAATPADPSAAPSDGTSPATGRAGSGSASPSRELADSSPLKQVAVKFGEMVDFSSAKLDELDKQFSGTLAEQGSRYEIQIRQLNDEKQVVGESVAAAIDEFSAAMSWQMTDELLKISEAELEYHSGMAAHLQQLVTTLKARQAAAPPRPKPKEPEPEAAPPRVAPESSGDATEAPAPIEASLAPVEDAEASAPAAEEETPKPRDEIVD